MRLLVTGGAGFVGSHVVARHAKHGDEVIALDNLSRREVLDDANAESDTATHNWEYISQFPSVKRVEEDVRNAEAIEELARDVDAVVHCAGQVAVTSSLQDRQEDFSTNARGTFNILEAARKAPSSPDVIFTSTNKVYGGNVNSIPVSEKDERYMYANEEYRKGIPETFPVDGCEHTPYGASKLSGDLYVQDYAHRNEINAAVFRMSCIFGTRQFGVEDQGWVAHFILSALRDRKISIYGDGKQVRDVLWVEDLVDAFDAYLERATSINSCVFNTGGGSENSVSLLELIKIIENQTGKSVDTAFEDWREGDQKVYISDISRAKDVLGWKPTTKVGDGVRQYIEWYQDKQ